MLYGAGSTLRYVKSAACGTGHIVWRTNPPGRPRPLRRAPQSPSFHTHLPWIVDSREHRYELLFFDDFRLGVLRGEEVVDVSSVVDAVPHIGPHDLINGLIARFEEHRGELEAAASGGPGIPLADVRIRPPLPRPTSIVCMAVNYMEDGTRKEPAPINAFLKSPSAVIGDGDTMVLPDVPATVFEGEAELAVVIGRRAEA